MHGMTFIGYFNHQGLYIESWDIELVNEANNGCNDISNQVFDQITESFSHLVKSLTDSQMTENNPTPNISISITLTAGISLSD